MLDIREQDRVLPSPVTARDHRETHSAHEADRLAALLDGILPAEAQNETICVTLAQRHMLSIIRRNGHRFGGENDARTRS